MSSTDSILKGKYPAKNHAKRVANYLQAAGYPNEGIIYLESQKTRLIEDNDDLAKHYNGGASTYCLLTSDPQMLRCSWLTLPAGNDVHFITSPAANCLTRT
jgi:hypothetical protein